MKVAFARPGQVPQPNVRMVALVVPMIVFISSMFSCLAAESPEVPEHAYITSWNCERGFKRTDDKCQSVKVPEHAFLTDYGDSWKCERGFKREDNRCSPNEG